MAMGTAYADKEDPVAELAKQREIGTDHAQIQEEVKSAGIEVEVVDWVYKQVTGESLVESLVTPITGDFTKIAANATAWEQVGASLSAVRANLNHGVGELRQSWDGAAAGAFEDLMVATWTVALEADAAAATLVGKGFTKVSDVSKQMCGKILNLIKKIVDDLIEVAATGWIPAAGWANAVRKVLGIIKYVDIALSIIEALKQLYSSVGELAKSVQAAGCKLSEIKDVHSVGDAVNYAFELKDTASDVREKAEAAGNAEQQVRNSAGGQEETGSDSTAETTGSGSSGHTRESGSSGQTHGSGSSGHTHGSSYHTAMTGHLD